MAQRRLRSGLGQSRTPLCLFRISVVRLWYASRVSSSLISVSWLGGWKFGKRLLFPQLRFSAVRALQMFNRVLDGFSAGANRKLDAQQQSSCGALAVARVWHGWQPTSISWISGKLYKKFFDRLDGTSKAGGCHRLTSKTRRGRTSIELNKPEKAQPR
ncbi:MAG: hypothetical protein K2X41_03605 [Hyphomicrobium sp.]|nr:hypothetical protein [Hyphomicrobium sp.]